MPPVSPFLTTTQNTSDWDIQCVDCPRAFSSGTDRSLQLDAEGHPHIAYGGDYLHYAWNDGIQWHYETVDYSPQTGYGASLILDEAGWPHIGYFDKHNGIRYAYKDAAGWHTETATGGGSSWLSLALDKANRPHIAYYTYDELKYAWHDGTAWHVQTLDKGTTGIRAGGMGIAGLPSLAIDKANHPHIIYHNYADYELRHAWRDGATWRTERIDDAGWPEDKGYQHFSAVLDLDSSGQPHVFYQGYDQYVGALLYAWRDNSGWHKETIKAGQSRYVPALSLTLDEQDSPHISYNTYYGDDKIYSYTWYDGSSWQYETVDRSSTMFIISLAVNESGQPHIAFLGSTIKYARKDETGWLIEIVDSSGTAGKYSSIALDGNDYPHIVYHGDGHLKHTWYDGESWRIETLPNGGKLTSLALNKANQPHIVYLDGLYLKYAHKDITGWHYETVDKVGLSSNNNNASMTLDESDHPHISYYVHYYDEAIGAANEDLRYAWHDGTEWYTETVDSAGDAGLRTSLALDGEGHPHISYLVDFDDLSSYSLRVRYARYDGSTWYTETVDSTSVPLKTSLALDKSGLPSIAYSKRDLRLARYNGTDWEIEAPQGDACELVKDVSMKLDSKNHPHIIYHCRLFRISRGIP